MTSPRVLCHMSNHGSLCHRLRPGHPHCLSSNHYHGAARAGYDNSCLLCCDAHGSAMRCSTCTPQACCTPVVHITAVCQLPARTCSNSASSTLSSFLRPRPLLAGFLVAPRRPEGQAGVSCSACGLGYPVSQVCEVWWHACDATCREDIIVSSKPGFSCVPRNALQGVVSIDSSHGHT